jgi:ABC-type lipoprotein release transport system permease subunit
MYQQLAWRNLWRNPRRTVIILTAIFIGVASMIFLASLMRGMMAGMVANAIDNLTGHIRIQDPAYRVDPSIDHRIDTPQALIEVITPILPPDAHLTLRLRADAVISTSRESAGVVLVGIESDSEKKCSFLGQAAIEGRMPSLERRNGLLIGRALMEKLGTHLGRKVVLMSQAADGETASQAFRIRGVYRTEMVATEKAYIFAPLATVQQMLGVGPGITEVSISLDQGGGLYDDLQPLTAALNQKLQASKIQAEDWRQMLPAMDAYLQMFNGMMYIWYLVVFVAMGFGLVNTVLMAVYERMREFGLLKALGMRSARIVRMVMGETLLLLCIGLAAGNLAAWLCITIVSRSGIDLTLFAQGVEMWGIRRMIWPVLTVWDVAVANLTVLLLGLVVSLYPAIRAARFTPIETMRQI